MFYADGKFWGFIATLIITGLFAAIEVLRKKNQQAATTLEQMKGAQSWIGLSLFAICLWTLIDVITSGFLRMLIPTYLGDFGFVRGLVIWLSSVVLFVGLLVGLVLGLVHVLGLAVQFNLLKQEQVGGVTKTIDPVKEKLGIVAVIAGVGLLVLYVVGKIVF